MKTHFFLFAMLVGTSHHMPGMEKRTDDLIQNHHPASSSAEENGVTPLFVDVTPLLNEAIKQYKERAPEEDLDPNREPEKWWYPTQKYGELSIFGGFTTQDDLNKTTVSLSITGEVSDSGTITSFGKLEIKTSIQSLN